MVRTQLWPKNNTELATTKPQIEEGHGNGRTRELENQDWRYRKVCKENKENWKYYYTSILHSR